jgi:hypothetical protein
MQVIDIRMRSACNELCLFLRYIRSPPPPLVGYVAARTTTQAPVDPAAAPDAGLELCLDAAIVAAC